MSYEEQQSSDPPTERPPGGRERILLRSGIDDVFDSLRSRRRRLVLLLLKQGTVETEADLVLRGDEEAESAEIDLRHNHLPKLADAGYIDWDPDSGEITKGPRFDEIEPLVELIENHADELPPGWP